MVWMLKINEIEKNSKFAKCSKIILILFFAVINFLSFVLFGLDLPFFCLQTLMWILFCVFFDIASCLNVALFLSTFEILNFPKYPITFSAMLSSVFAFVFAIKYLITMKKNFFSKNFFIVGLTIILMIYGLINFNKSEFGSVLSSCVILVIIYLIYEQRDMFCVLKTCKIYLRSMCVNIILGLILMLFENTRSIVLYQNLRFMSLCGNPNQLQLFCCLGLSIVCCLRIIGIVNLYDFGTYALLFCITGIATLSKTFLLIAVMVCIIFIIGTFRKSTTRGFLCVGIGIGVVPLVFKIFEKKSDTALARFFEYTQGGLMDKLLTGRVSIWSTYISVWKENMVNILFGVGVSASRLVDIGTHSGYVDMLYKYGIIGCVLILMLVIAYLVSFKNHLSRKMINYLPVLVFLVISIEEMLFYTKYIFVFIMLIFFIFKSQKYYFLSTKTKKGDIYDTKNYSLCVGRR